MGCGVAVLLVGVLTSGRWARATAERTARCLEQPEIQEVTAGASVLKRSTPAHAA